MGKNTTPKKANSSSFSMKKLDSDFMDYTGAYKDILYIAKEPSSASSSPSPSRKGSLEALNSLTEHSNEDTMDVNSFFITTHAEQLLAGLDSMLEKAAGGTAEI